MTTDIPNLPVTLKRARKAAGFSNAKDFLAAVRASGRQAPSYSTYAQWESGGVEPRDETLDPIIAYHRERGTWPEEPAGTDLATAILAQAEAMTAQAEAFNRLADAIERMGDRVTQRVEDSAAAFEDVVAALRKQQPRDGAAAPPASGRTP